MKSDDLQVEHQASMLRKCVGDAATGAHDVGEFTVALRLEQPDTPFNVANRIKILGDLDLVAWTQSSLDVGDFVDE